ncbi:Endocytosis and vacuole integrity protein, partial [Coemansia sp. RSA 2322]
MASATSISSLLLSELQSLCTEARRKHPDVKEAAERVIVILRGIKATASAEIAAELAKSDEVIRPFVLACRSGNSRLTAVAVHCLQQLVSRQAISTGSVRETLSTLNTVAGQGVDIQVKVLQMVLPLVTIYDGSVSGETLVEAFALCLTLQRSRDAIVSNTAAAILRQAVVAVFDRVVAEDRELGSGSADDVSETTSEQDMTRRRAKDAFFVLQDLCLLAGDGDPIFIRTDHSVDKRLVLELLESVLANHAGVVARHPAMAQVLRERLAPFIVNFFAERASFALAVRCIRIVWLFVRDLHGDLKPECEIFLSILARLVDSGGDYPQFYRVLALEVARDTLENAVLLHRLYLQYDGRMAAVGTASAEQPGGAGAREEDCHVILDLITAVCRVVSERPAPGGDGGAGLIGADSCRMRMELSKLLDKQEAPGVPDAYVFYLAAASVLSFVEGLAGHVLPQCTESVGCRFRHSRHARASQRQVEATVAVLGVSPPLSEPGAAGALVLAAWPAMQAALGFIAGAQLDEPLFARMVGSTRQLAQAAGALGLADARDVLLAQLCRGSLPAAEAPLHLVHARQVQCLRATIACAQYLASVLGPTWYLLLVTVQQVEEVLYQSRGRAPTAAATGTAAAARRGSLSAAATPVMGGSSGDDVAGSSQASDLAAVREDFARLLAAVRASTAGSSDAVMWVVRGLCLLGSDLGGAPMDHDQEITTAMRRRLEALLPEAAPERRVSVANDRPTFATEELRAFAVENVDLLMGAAGGSGGADEGVGAQAWAAIVDCLLTSATSAQAAAGQRTQACEAVADVVLAAMALVTQQPGGDEGSSGGDFAALVASGEAQVRILRPLAQMMAQSGAQAQAGEVRKLTLDTLHRLLQASGHSLTRAWGVVFDIIQGVLRESSAMEAGRHQQQEAELLARGVFPCLQLICTDYLADLPADCLRRCIEALLVQFASQRQDLNIALTAIGQAWALCDFFHGFPQPEEAEECGDAGEDFGSSGADAAAEAWWSEPLVGGVARRRTQRVLWLLLLHSLARLGRDARHEVRLGGIQTLFRALDMHGGSFDGAVWDGVVWGVVLPLAQYVLSQRAHVFSLLRQGRVDELLQRADRGPGGDAAGDTRASGMVAEDPQRLLRAQWDETAAAALLGVTRTWGAAGGSGSGSGGGAWRVGQAELAWRRVWALTQGLFVGGTCAGDDVGAGSAALRSSASVAAGLACARVLVAQSSNSDYSARASWAAWLAMGLSVTDASSSEGACDDDDSSDAVSQDVLCDLLELGPALVAGLAKQQAFGDSDCEALLALVRRLVAYDGAPLHASDATEMSRLQRLALGSIDLIAGSGDDGSSAALV